MRLTVEHLTVRLSQKTIVDDLSTTFDSGTSTALMGPSGSGKSTLLGTLAGEIRANHGRMTFDECPQTCAELSEITEWIHQDSPMLMRRTALDNSILSSILQGADIARAQDDALQLMAQLDISHLADQRAYKLSGGERQRIAVVRSLLSGRAILLADEPTASLDASSRRLVCETLGLAASQGRIVIIATHDQYVAARADRVVRLG